MPVSLRRINKGEGNRKLTIPYEGGETLTLAYNRSKYTPKRERELREKIQENLPGGMLSEFLMDLIVEWDAVDVHPDDREKAESLEAKMQENGEGLPTVRKYEEEGIRMVPVPLTAETFDILLSVEAQSAVVAALSSDQRPNPKKSDSTNDFL